MVSRLRGGEPRRRAYAVRRGAAIVALTAAAVFSARGDDQASNNLVVLGFNDLGMHCMNGDFSELMILPPYNTLRAQVIDRAGEEPHIVTSGITVRYSIPSNTHSFDKTNFWRYAPQLLGVNLPPNIGLTGHGLSGTMTPTGRGDFNVTGIPITPIDDSGRDNPYALGLIAVVNNGQVVARTQTVVPVSWEISCNRCHASAEHSTATDILMAHDNLHGTDLLNHRPVMCASCHADPALGTPGAPGVPNMSAAVHTAHADRVDGLHLVNECYACHPGFRTQCQRDVHLSRGITCRDCHGDMRAVGDSARRPWVDEPRCGSCHVRAGFEFEQANTLYKDSKGHSNIDCAACHGSPHAIAPTVTAIDNVQAITRQGHAGEINTCTVCHSTTPGDPFFHRVSDD